MSRSQLRQQLLDRRMALAPAQRAQFDRSIGMQLELLLRRHAALKEICTIGAYWPIRNEPDLRDLLGLFDDEGHTIGLPDVIAPDAALRFLRWQAGQAMVAGAHNIPVPQQSEVVTPQVLLVPCVGFWIDAKGQRYRLGYGGGYYDRTLATLRPASTLVIGVAYECTRLTAADAFEAGTHDVPMMCIVTEAGVI